MYTLLLGLYSDQTAQDSKTSINNTSAAMSVSTASTSSSNNLCKVIMSLEVATYNINLLCIL